MKKLDLFYRLSIGLVFLVVLSGCAAPQAKENFALQTIKVQKSLYLSYAPLFIALDEGFFKEQALEVELVPFTRSSEAIPAIIQGDLDVLGGSMSLGFLNAIAQNATLKIVADKGNEAKEHCPYSAIVTRNDLAPQISGVADLKGRNVTLNDANYEGYMWTTLLKPAGLTLKDLHITDVELSAMLDALSGGAIDFTTTAEPWLTRLLTTGDTQVWHAAIEVIPDFQSAVLLFGPSFLEKNREVGVRFMMAYLKGVRQYREGKTERNLEIIAKYTELETDLLKAVCWPDIHADGSINANSLSGYQDWALDEGLLVSKVEEQQFWDPYFIEQANKELGTP